jgi:hypothetical protein
MASNGAIPPPIPEVPDDQKFDGGVHLAWAPIERKIKTALRSQGVIGYADGSIIRKSHFCLGDLRVA